MKVLLIGSGGREHALAWKLAQSPWLTKLWIAPGNAGAARAGEILPIPAEDSAGLMRAALDRQVDLVVIGPETPLAAGLSDALRRIGVRVFAPSQAAAQLETSKVFAKNFMARRGIPTARFSAFDTFEPALDCLRAFAGASQLPVIKASGLAAGKGVLLPQSIEEGEQILRRLMLEDELGSAGREVVIEERLSGREISLLAFTDGATVRAMPPAQDHKRLLDGDRGPNTGGMGAIAPAPACPPELAAHLQTAFLQTAVDGLRAEGMPYVGVLYAGLMLTPDGPKALEYNCRFGDPETQALLPLLESDLLEIMLACVEGRLHAIEPRWKPGAAACVVQASAGYPGKALTGQPIFGSLEDEPGSLVFHAATRQENGRWLTAGGRVLGVTGVASTLDEAIAQAYARTARVGFEGAQWRRDIGGTSVEEPAYTLSGVSIAAGNRAVALMKAAVESTYGGEVLAGIGAFGGLWDAAALKAMDAPVLVASTDGVGTKVKLAAQVGRYRSIGHDIVNHCINDILVQGARPLFFLDYFATAKLTPEITAEVVGGIAEACRDAGCALLGGETAEMPGVYAPGEFDVAGTIVGVVERQAVLPRRAQIRPGDVLLGLASSGAHTNGYSLIRKVFACVPLETVFPELGVPLADALLAPHRSYLPLLQSEICKPQSAIKALAHLTGGGFIENIPRVLPEGVGAQINRGSWPVPPLFSLIQLHGAISSEEMHRVFNMGIGMVLVAAPEDAAALRAALAEECWEVGRLVAGKGVALV